MNLGHGNLTDSSKATRLGQIKPAVIQSHAEGQVRLGRYWIIALFVLVLAFAASCGRRPNVPESSPDSSQKLPFDRQARANGVSPTQALVPAATRLPEGTPITIRLGAQLSSASAHAGDTFDGSIDSPVVTDGQALVPRGAAIVGRVLDAKPSDGTGRGYLRVGLVSIQVDGKTVLLDTTSIFVKSGARDGGAARDVVFPLDRRLTFHVTQGVDLP